MSCARLPVVSLILMVAGCSSWHLDNPDDPYRCEPACLAPSRCVAARCVPPLDAGPDLASSELGGPDTGQDAAADSSPTDVALDTGQDAAADTSPIDAGPDIGPAALKWSWAAPIKGPAADDYARGDAVATDAQGNIYVAGMTLSKSITVGGKTLSSGARTRKLFVAKLNPAGNALWLTGAPLANTSGGYYTGAVSGLQVTAAGEVLLSGTFENCSVTLGSTVLSTTGAHYDGFLARMDAKGTFQWALQVASAGGSKPDDSLAPLRADSKGNMYVAGYFKASTLTLGSTVLTNAGTGSLPGADIFVARVDSGGSFTWAARAGGVGNDHGRGVALDGSGGVTIVGEFNSASVTAGGKTYPRPGAGTDLLVARLDSAGKFKWVTLAGGAGKDQASSVVADSGGASYIVGHFTSAALKLGSTTLVNVGDWDGLVARLDSAGGFTWARAAGGNGTDWPSKIVLGAGGPIICGEFYSSSAMFGTIPVSSWGKADVILAGLDTTGTFTWVLSAGGTANDACRDLVLGLKGSVLTTGFYNSVSAAFGTTSLTNKDSSIAKGFVARASVP